MGCEDIEGIVVSKGKLELGRKVANGAGQETEEDGGGCEGEQVYKLGPHRWSLGSYLREPTKPEAGVMATKPETAPEQKPTADHLRSRR